MLPQKPRRVLAYARVSSVEQTLGTSLTDQQDVMRRYAGDRGVPVSKFYVESESGIHEKLEKRVQMRALLADVRAGDLVLCDKLDRWSRDPEFTYSSVRRILEAKASFYAVGDACDPSTSEGDTTLGFRILFAREEHKRIKQRLVGTRNLLLSKGYYAVGMVPLGYHRQEDTKHRLDRNVLVVVPVEAETVRTIFRRYVAGESMATVARSLAIGIDLVKNTLHRRVYLGEVQAPPSAAGLGDGPWVKGQHEAIIDRDLFDRAQGAIATRTAGGPRPRRAASETSGWILRDVARCGLCGAKMSSAYGAKTVDGARLYYYHCTKRCEAKGPRGRTSYLQIEPYETEGAEAVEARIAAIRSVLAKPPADEPSPKAPAKAQRETLATKRARYIDAHGEGVIELPELRERLAKIDLAVAELDAAEATPKPSPLADPKVRRAMLADLDELEHALSNLDGVEMRQLVNVFVVQAAMVKGEALMFTWRSGDDVFERLTSVRDMLVAALGRAPSRAEVRAAVLARFDK